MYKADHNNHLSPSVRPSVRPSEQQQQALASGLTNMDQPEREGERSDEIRRMGPERASERQRSSLLRIRWGLGWMDGWMDTLRLCRDEQVDVDPMD